MLLWCVALRTQTLDRFKIILKAPLRQAPIFGWAMQHFLFIFLVRSTDVYYNETPTDIVTES